MLPLSTLSAFFPVPNPIWCSSELSHHPNSPGFPAVVLYTLGHHPEVLVMSPSSFQVYSTGFLVLQNVKGRDLPARLQDMIAGRSCGSKVWDQVHEPVAWLDLQGVRRLHLHVSAPRKHHLVSCPDLHSWLATAFLVPVSLLLRLQWAH